MRIFVKELQAGGSPSSAAGSKGAAEQPASDADIKAKGVHQLWICQEEISSLQEGTAKPSSMRPFFNVRSDLVLIPDVSKSGQMIQGHLHGLAFKNVHAKYRI